MGVVFVAGHGRKVVTTGGYKRLMLFMRIMIIFSEGYKDLSNAVEVVF